MTDQVSDWTCYHVTRQLPYNPHASLTVGSEIESGEASNPFYGFYETPRRYSVTMQDGSVVQYGAIGFLKGVERGEISSPQLPTIAAEISNHYLMLARELLMEMVRLECAPLAPSRQSALWVTPDLEAARIWQDRLGSSGRILQLSATGKVHLADAGLLLGDAEAISETKAKAVQYWTQFDQSTAVEPEALFAGRATVVAEVC
ncbi:DUF2441 domain-containing protein [Sinorhizobium terangae]|uniref:DUF2441 domain-containing protein n=1 Tax=Sinorhizobium terangae TaxID=110322 RepID=UPI0024B12FE7|nr:DUF2441 domain-containing protein [Sinorhizobium terangae]WFU47726.1 DUF2441 domain-containing protein [Sinorhizobium terangae]